MAVLKNTVSIVKKFVYNNKRVFHLLCIATIFVCWILYVQISAINKSISPTPIKTSSFDLIKMLVKDLSEDINLTKQREIKYVVKAPNCLIPDIERHDLERLQSFHPKKYIACRTKDLLTYAKKVNNTAALYINKRLIKQYTNDSIECYYRYVERSSKLSGIGNIDNHISFSERHLFEHNVTLTKDTVHVECFNSNATRIYRNVHAVVNIKEEVKNKTRQHGTASKEQLSILIVGIDGVSRFNFIRSLPLTHSFLKKNNWIDFKGYSKVGDDNFSNMMAILTGLNETAALKICNPRKFAALDECKMIWYDYRKFGFVTAYGEDETSVNAFSSSEGGFYKEPTDYYFRPYLRATDLKLPYRKINNLKYCTGPETAGERIFNLARDFTTTFKNCPTFSVFWMNSYSRNDMNTVSRMDKKIVNFLEGLDKQEILKNSLTLFISNHGYRSTSRIFTRTGWFENKLPFFYMSVPVWFKKKYPSKYKNLLRNTEKLISPFDVYMTLQNILFLYHRSYRVKKSDGCPKCKSLFKAVELERSCEDAGIQHQRCSCYNYENFNKTSFLARKAVEFIINRIHKVKLINYRKCVHFKLNKIINAAIVNNYLPDKPLYFLIITFETRPLAKFQGIVNVNMSRQFSSFKIIGKINRLDKHSKNSWCTKDKNLKPYCYCKKKRSKTISDSMKKKFSVSGSKSYIKLNNC